MSDRKAVVKNADMSEDMQQDAIDCAAQAMEKYNIEKDIAAYIKKEFDKKYSECRSAAVATQNLHPAWPGSSAPRRVAPPETHSFWWCIRRERLRLPARCEHVEPRAFHGRMACSRWVRWWQRLDHQVFFP